MKKNLKERLQTNNESGVMPNQSHKVSSKNVDVLIGGQYGSE